MNEVIARRLIAQAANATGPIGTEKQFWTTVLTGLNNGVFSSANNEHEFWRKFAALMKTRLTPLPANQRIITSGQKIIMPQATGTYTDGYTFTVSGGNITAITAS